MVALLSIVALPVTFKSANSTLSFVCNPKSTVLPATPFIVNIASP